MKKILCIATAMLIFGCGSDDNSGGSSSNKAFFDITIDGQNYRHEYNEGHTAWGTDVDNCLGGNYVIDNIVGDIVTSSFDLQALLFHYETTEDFDGSNSNVNYISAVDYYSLWFLNDCKRNFELSLAYEDTQAGEYLEMANGGNHEITSVSLYREDSQEKTYKVEGNFEGNLIAPNGALKSFNGNYRAFIYVLK